jgi:hypothetical protein
MERIIACPLRVHAWTVAGYCHFGTAETIDCGHEQNENPEVLEPILWDAPVIVGETFHARAVSVGKMPTGEVFREKCHAFGVPPLSEFAGLAAFGNRMIIL